VEEDGTVHGVLLWIDYGLGFGQTVSNYPVNGCGPTWKRQGVYVLNPFKTTKKSDSVLCEASYDPYENKISLNFQ